jgi:PKD repeat protein
MKLKLLFSLFIIVALSSQNSFSQSTTYDASTTINIPAGVTKATIQAWGGGGKGGTRTSNGAAGGGGGGAYTISTLTGLTAGSYAVTVGAGSTTTDPGGTSIFGANLVTANGGNSVANNTEAGASGGAGGTYSGGNGANGQDFNFFVRFIRSGGGGSSAGTNANGANANNNNGGTAPTGGGDGGDGRGYFDAGNGSVGVSPGGGGGGATGANSGGNGANGQVIVCLWPAANYTSAINNSIREVTFTNTSTTNSTSYLWDFGDTNTSTATSPTHTYTANGTYTVTLTSTNACGSDVISFPITVDDTLGIDDEILSTFNLYPNPVTHGTIKLTLPTEIEEFEVTISSLLGQQLYKNSYLNSYNKIHEIDATSFKKGLYIITVSTKNGKATKKLIID